MIKNINLKNTKKFLLFFPFILLLYCSPDNKNDGTPDEFEEKFYNFAKDKLITPFFSLNNQDKTVKINSEKIEEFLTNNKTKINQPGDQIVFTDVNIYDKWNNLFLMINYDIKIYDQIIKDLKDEDNKTLLQTFYQKKLVLSSPFYSFVKSNKISSHFIEIDDTTQSININYNEIQSFLDDNKTEINKSSNEVKFKPTENEKYNEWKELKLIVEFNNNKSEILGKLDQTHKDLLEAFLLKKLSSSNYISLKGIDQTLFDKMEQLEITKKINKINYLSLDSFKKTIKEFKDYKEDEDTPKIENNILFVPIEEMITSFVNIQDLYKSTDPIIKDIFNKLNLSSELKTFLEDIKNVKIEVKEEE